MTTWHDRWHAGHPLFLVLLPLAALFAAVVALRRLAWRHGWLSAWRAPVPVIVVGNLTVGGTGKTPLTLALVERLQAAGWRPGIVSRGYGGSTTYPAQVSAAALAAEVGDEPLLLARRTNVPVVVDPLRARGVRALLAATDCNVVLCDDGLQHYALARDIELVVIDGQRGLGSGWPLPAGPLREPASRLAEADFVVVNGDWQAPGCAPAGAHVLRLQPGHWQPVPANASCSLDAADMMPEPPRPGDTVHAIAGIGNPGRFFSLLQRLGYHVLPQAFPDHHAYTAEDLRRQPPHPLVMTEKDAVKCAGIAPAECWYLPVRAELPDAFWSALLARLDSWRP